MVRIATLILVSGLALADTAAAQAIISAGKGEAGKAAPPSLRYRFSHTADGVLRLDGETGQVVLCRPQGQGWACDAAPEKAAAAGDGALKDADLATLKAQLTQLQSQLGPPDEDKAREKAHDDAIAELQAGNAALKNEIGALKAQLAELDKKAVAQDAWQAVISRLAVLEQNAGGTAGMLTRLEREKKELAAQLESVTKDVAAQLDARSAAVAQAQKESQDQIKAQGAEIARLKDENAGLKASIAAMESESAVMHQQLAELMPPPPPVPPAAVPPKDDDKPKLPSRVDLDRARAAIADAWRRTVEMIENLRRDLTRKDDGSVRL